jgi:hypothetical protein
MDGNTHSAHRAGNRGMARKLDGYTVHLLALDGTIATVRRKRSDGTFQLIVDIGDRRGERRISAAVARNPRSAAFARAVGKVKAELLGGRKP